ncbi:coatomer subunit delta [Zalaria obscura]|uniref:Coatomer subunit delta n=1 Tax=Zalaria obscura TaxID=2024903 RepID=A0ACC3S3N9_9PEZI
MYEISVQGEGRGVLREPVRHLSGSNTSFHDRNHGEQVVLAASICTRGGKAVLSRQFREMQRSRIEGLLASFPKLADSSTQHTTVEQDNVRFVYQPLDELYMVLITNRQSNILQDIDSLHLFAQVVTSICRSLDEREILRNAFELLSAFDELVTLGYRENLTLSQIKTFLDMESHEERIQDIIARNKELEASEERKRKAKQLEMQRKEMSRSGRGNMPPRAPNYPTYTAPAQPAVPDTYDSYNAEKNKTFQKPLAVRGKGMQLGKKTKTTSMFEQVRGDLGPEAEVTAPLVPSSPAVSAPQTQAAGRTSLSSDREGLHITVAESISAKLSREGSLEAFEVKGDLQLRITDPALTQVKLNLDLGDIKGAQLNSHPKVDKTMFRNSKIIQLTDTSKGFPANNAIGVMRWRMQAKPGEVNDPPITFTTWVNETSTNTYNITLEYELTGGDSLKDVTVVIPYSTSEPSVSSFDAVYEVSGDSIDWTIGDVDEDNASGSFEFEAQASSEAEFFPMNVRFAKSKPFVEVDVASVSLLSMGQDISFSKDVRSVAEAYQIV